MIEISELKKRFLTMAEATASAAELHALDIEIYRCIDAVKGAQTFKNAGPHLVRLGEIQEILAAAWFRHGVEISEIQKRLVQNYDRPDDEDLRKFVFEKIRLNEFIP